MANERNPRERNPRDKKPTSKKPSSKKANPNKTRDLIIRLVVFGVLGIFAVLVLLDVQKQSQYNKTGQKWMTMFDEAKNKNPMDTDLPVESLRKEIVGSPTETQEGKQLIFTWSGLFRSNKITVELDPINKAQVQEIRGPARAAAAE